MTARLDGSIRRHSKGTYKEHWGLASLPLAACTLAKMLYRVVAVPLTEIIGPDTKALQSGTTWNNDVKPNLYGL